MAQGVIFNNDTPLMEGNWYNPKTGDKFTVKNTFFEDNQLVVQTTDGRMLEYNQLQYYIQGDDKSFTNNPPKQDPQLPSEVASLIEDNDYDDMLNDDMRLIMSNSNSQDSQFTTDNIYKVKTVEDTNTVIINKALAKHELPRLNVSIDNSTFPEYNIKMLYDIMDIPVEDITNWYINSIDINEIKKQISKQIQAHISEMCS